ncbi:glycosyltransferase family 2 protein [Clostridium vincentii]|uniref:Chondroitin synthase n=1 Tax=Clostridium vincentii TaxID=52704 RepID=A0A2T0BGM1_9CLOT|nr:glycosyltransferase family 2 protein [Clostridium vincentii]PRR83056.1 Chondroitin synthase [Clostridium vincentii]
MRSIRFCIDDILVTEDKTELVVTGWAYAESKQPIKIEMVNVDYFKVEKFERPDIFHQYKEESLALETGFKITIPYKEKNKIVFSTKDEEATCNFRSNDKTKTQKSRSKLDVFMFIFDFSNIGKLFKYIMDYGVMDTLIRIKRVIIKTSLKGIKYNDWLNRERASTKELEKQRKHVFEYSPKISIVVATYNTTESNIRDMMKSLIKQTYSNWELCIVDGASNNISTIKVLKEYQNKYDNIKGNYLSENSITLNSVYEELKLTSGEFVGLLNQGDFLELDALYKIVEGINNNRNVDFIYTDEDRVSDSGKEFSEPQFKPDWAPDTFRSYNYISNFAVFSKKLLENIGEFKDNQNYDLLLKLTEGAQEILHISKVLYHGRSYNKNKIDIEEDKEAIKNQLERIGAKGIVEDGLFQGSYKVEYEIADNPLVSIIIPNKDEHETLKACIESIFEKSTYKNFEIIIVENNSTEDEIFKYYEELASNNKIRVITWDKEFNYSAINNYAFNETKGEYIVFLNNDIEVITPNWIEEMLMHTQRMGIGITGAKLYYPDDTIQHAGVILGLRGVAGHSHGGFKRDDLGFCGRLKIIQNLSAVTAACLMIRRSVYEEVEGFDEEFPVAFNDIDFCLKVRGKGHLIIFTPFVEMYHYESKSRGEDTTVEKIARFEKEVKRFHKKWGLWIRDPYYNDNLTLDEEDFSLKV